MELPQKTRSPGGTGVWAGVLLSCREQSRDEQKRGKRTEYSLVSNV